MNVKSYVIALAIVAVLALWMLSGQLVGDSQGSVAEDAGGAKPAEAMTVQVAEQQAGSVQRRLEAQGEALPNRRVSVRAETTGRVEAVLFDKGATVSQGEPLVRLAMNDRQARLQQARARLAQREADYEAAERLGASGYQSETRKREAFAALETARAELAAIEDDIANTRIGAPFDGVLEDRMVEQGDYVTVGDPVAAVVDRNPLKVRVDIAQQEIRKLSSGTNARVELATGDVLDGTVTYIAPSANEGTHTFPVEIRVPNDGGLPAGVSATVVIPLDTKQAHFLSPAVLALDSDGELGAKTVDADNIVRFHPVSIVRTERDGVWVTGLPSSATLITRGQGYVRAGEQVNVQRASQSDEKGALPAPQDPPGVSDG